MRVTGPLFKWFGSKWLSSKTLPAPIHDSIVEPFAGGAGYSLRHCDKRVTIAERALKGQVIVCEAVCPKTNAVPDYLPFQFFGSRITSRRKAENNHHSKELIYVCAQ